MVLVVGIDLSAALNAIPALTIPMLMGIGHTLYYMLW